jgi:hypothetical protein
MSDIRDNPALHRYEMEVDGHIAIVVYHKRPGLVTIVHTEVPHELEGRGIGSAMMKGVLAIIRASGDKVVPRCSFVSAYLARHPEYNDMVSP